MIEGREKVNNYIRENIPAGAYLVTGDALLCDHVCKSMIRKLTECKPGENPFDRYPFDCFMLEGTATDAEALIDLALRVPAQTPALCIVVRDYPFAEKGNTDALRSLYGFIPRLPDTTYLIFHDARGECFAPETPSVKSGKDKGSAGGGDDAPKDGKDKSDGRIVSWKYAADFFTNNGTLLYSFAEEAYAVTSVTGGIASRNKANKTDVRIGGAAARELVSRVGTDLFRLRGEVDKLYAFASPDGEITPENVRALAAESVTGSAFDIVKCIADRDYDRAFRISHHLLLNGTKPEMITGSLVSVFSDAYRLRIINKYKNGIQKEYRDVYNKGLRSDNRLPGFSAEQLRRVIRVLTETDLRSKTFSAGGRQATEGDFDELLASIIAIHKNNA